MERTNALIGGLVVAILIFGGFVAVRTISRFLRAMVWFAETVALVGLAFVFGYLAYRVLWGVSDDPRVH